MKTGLFLFLTAGLLVTPSFAGPPEDPTEEGEFIPAVVLRKPYLKTPIEAAGTGLSPEGSVVVQVDARGIVTDVQVVKIDPSSDHDEHFQRTVIDTISQWRYAPARRNGVDVPTELRWTVQFMARGKEKENQGQGAGWRLTSINVDEVEDNRRRILMLPAPQRITMLRAETAAAVSFMQESSRRKVESVRFTVYSDAADDGPAETVAGNMEVLFKALDDLLGDSIDAQLERYKLVVIMYEDKKAFMDYKRATRMSAWASGFYQHVGMLALSRDMFTNESLQSTLLHEGTHAFLDKHVIKPGGGIPRWLNEGFAEYIGNSRIKKGVLIPGKTMPGQIYQSAWGMVLGASFQTISVEVVREAIRQDRALSIPEILDADAGTFYGEKRHLFYPMSWLLVHYLQHGRESWGARQFADFLLYVSEGYPLVESFEAVYGVHPTSLEKEFQRYIRKF